MSRKLLMLPISDRRGASARYRVYQFETALRAAGFDLHIEPPAPKGKGLSRVMNRRREERRFLGLAKEADVVFIQKRLLSCGFVDGLAGTGKPIVFDFDDAIFTSAHKTRSATTRRRVLLRLKRVLEVSSLVLAGNRYLAEFAGEHARHVEIVPTSVDVERYPVKEHAAIDPVVLGWTGSSATQPYLDLIAPVLEDAVNEMRLKFVVVSDGEYGLPGVDIDCRRWSEETEMDDLLNFDIGLMPLVDNEWTRGKCALKALQYMAAGIPPVCEAVGAAREIIDHGEDGFLCESHEEWNDAIRQLAGDASLRAEIGRKGRAKVEDRFSLRGTGERLAQLLQGLV